MSQFNCPHCEQPAFSRWDKYLAAKWKILNCPLCDKRVCSQPLWLALFYLGYLIDVIDLSYLAYLERSLNYVVAMVVGWAILDFFSIYLPLAAMRGKVAENPESLKRENSTIRVRAL